MKRLSTFLGIGVLIGCLALGTVWVTRHPTLKHTKEADAAYKVILDKLGKAQSVSFRYVSTSDQTSSADEIGSFVFSKPNRFRLDSQILTRVSSGETIYTLIKKTKSATEKSAISVGSRPYGFFWGFESLLGFNIEMEPSPPQLTEYQDKPALQVRYSYKQAMITETVDSYYSLQTNLPVAALFTTVIPNQGTVKMTVNYSDVVLDPVLPKDTFDVKPKRGEILLSVRESNSKLIKVGAVCPDFQTKTIDSQPINRTNLLSQNKAVLLFFWQHG